MDYESFRSGLNAEMCHSLAHVIHRVGLIFSLVVSDGCDIGDQGTGVLGPYGVPLHKRGKNVGEGGVAAETNSKTPRLTVPR